MFGDYFAALGGADPQILHCGTATPFFG